MRDTRHSVQSGCTQVGYALGRGRRGLVEYVDVSDLQHHTVRRTSFYMWDLKPVRDPRS